jgi:hypothetical protein
MAYSSVPWDREPGRAPTPGLEHGMVQTDGKWLPSAEARAIGVGPTGPERWQREDPTPGRYANYGSFTGYPHTEPQTVVERVKSMFRDRRVG